MLYGVVQKIQKHGPSKISLFKISHFAVGKEVAPLFKMGR